MGERTILAISKGFSLGPNIKSKVSSLQRGMQGRKNK